MFQGFSDITGHTGNHLYNKFSELLRGRPGVRIPFGAPDNNAESLCFQGFSAFLLSSKRKNNQASLGEVFLFYCCKGIMVRVFRIAYIIQ